MFRHVDEMLRSTIPHKLFFRASVDPNDTHGHTSARQLYDLSTRSLTSSVLGVNQTDLHRNVSFAMSWLAEPSSYEWRRVKLPKPPPAPDITTHWPDLACDRRRAAKVVTPAQSIGLHASARSGPPIALVREETPTAASSDLSLSGIGVT